MLPDVTVHYEGVAQYILIPINWIYYAILWNLSLPTLEIGEVGVIAWVYSCSIVISLIFG